MSISLTAADVVAIAPELTGEDSRITALISDLQPSFEAGAWSSVERATRALKWFVAHLATVQKRGGAAGPVQSEKVGEVSRTYAVSTSGDQDQACSTPYGQMYQRIVRAEFAGPRVL